MFFQRCNSLRQNYKLTYLEFRAVGIAISSYHFQLSFSK